MPFPPAILLALLGQTPAKPISISADVIRQTVGGASLEAIGQPTRGSHKAKTSNKAKVSSKVKVASRLKTTTKSKVSNKVKLSSKQKIHAKGHKGGKRALVPGVGKNAHQKPKTQ